MRILSFIYPYVMNIKNINIIFKCSLTINIVVLCILVLGCDPRPLPLPSPPPPRGSPPPPPCGDLIVSAITPDPNFDKYYDIQFLNVGQGTVSLPGSYP